MNRYLFIDSRMRTIEKQTLKKLGYNLIELKKNNCTYDEISSHVDIFCTKLIDKIVLEKSIYSTFPSFCNSICGYDNIGQAYPDDIKYNVCNIGDFVIHNFNYTDKKVLEVIDELNLSKINIKQGYSKCSIAVIDSNSCIVTDEKIQNILKQHGIDVLLIDEHIDIKLLKDNGFSSMKGFIGGCISRIDNNIFISGDLKKIDKDNSIEKYIKSRNLNIIDFPDLDVIDYGGIVVI